MLQAEGNKRVLTATMSTGNHHESRQRQLGANAHVDHSENVDRRLACITSYV